MARVVHENARLVHELVDFEDFWNFTNSLEIAVDYAVRVEVAETVRNVRQLD